MQATTQVQAANAAQAIGTLSIQDMFLHAHFIVKAVMIFLGLCSILTFSILIEKTLLFMNARRTNAGFLAAFRSAGNVCAMLSITDTKSLTGRMWEGAKAEYHQFMDMHPDSQYTPHQADRFLQRVALSVGVVQENELARLGKYMGILATIGSTAPFIGLFGTVWGILHSFAQIAASQSSSLAVVAPGIAEALLATAIGLFAAIPAVMIYNKFVRDMNHFVGSLDNFASEMITVLSRKLDSVG
jgi:TolQ protein